jgi:uncharacterized membrane protein YfcA
MSVLSLVIVCGVGVIGGWLAAIAGAGIGSTLVPFFALHVDLKVAVALATIPHLAGGLVRAVQLRKSIDRAVLLRFGIVCAIASLVGALVHDYASSILVTYFFAAMLVIAGVLLVFGLGDRVRPSRGAGWIAGAASGFFGGFAGEQGGLRAIGLLPFGLRKEAFVATTTAVGVAIDVFRLPVYVATEPSAFASGGAIVVVVATAGVIIGTLAGMRLLRRLPEQWFKRVLGVILVVIGALMMLQR